MGIINLIFYHVIQNINQKLINLGIQLILNKNVNVTFVKIHVIIQIGIK